MFKKVTDGTTNTCFKTDKIKSLGMVGYNDNLLMAMAYTIEYKIVNPVLPPYLLSLVIDYPQ